MKVLCKLVDPTIETVIPKYAKGGDAGLDFIATSVTETSDYIEYGTNIAVEIPFGFAGFMMPRSSISKYDLTLCNSVGLIDSGYRGEIKFRFKRLPPKYPFIESKAYEVGDKIGQLVVLQHPHIELELTDELTDTERGNGGFGSSGK
jgi:dUTP pyrophosphatase